MVQHITTTKPPAVSSPVPAAKLLRSVLRENAIFSFLSGVFLVAAGASIDGWLGLNQWLIMGGGLGLIAFGSIVWRGAADDDTLGLTGRTAVAGDLGWIVAAIVIVAATDLLTSNGERALLLISVPVLLFAIGQGIGLRRFAD